MVRNPEASRVYIIYQHSLFAEGIRSLLQKQSAVRIIGAERDRTKALKDVKALKPSVILIEESTTDPQQFATWDMLHRPGAGRVVALNLHHSAATVYDRKSLPISTPVDLLQAVKGRARSPLPEESTPHPGRGSRAQTVPRAKIPIPKGKTEPRKGRA